MLCLACSRPSGAVVCGDCLRSLRRGPERALPGGLRVVAAFEHEGPARALVHRLKYDGIGAPAPLLAAAMAERVPPGAVLTPIPRTPYRRVRHGIDPARVLARELSRLTGLPVAEGLVPALWSPRHAGTARRRRTPPRFRRSRALEGAILVDDVLTTGSTLLAAEDALGRGAVEGAVTATAASIRPTATRRVSDP